MRLFTQLRHRLLAVGVAGALAASVLVSLPSLPAGAATTATVPAGAVALVAPDIPGVAPLPGPVAKVAQPSLTMGILDVVPDQGVVGTPMTISGTALRPSTTVELTWSTADVTWMLSPQPGTVNYMGRYESKFAVVLDTVKTDAKGAFKVSLKAPADWGGVHDIYAVIGNREVDHGGFITLRSLTVTPRSGPIGTPITITYSGLGASEYEGGAALLWDNKLVGEMMANWTRGVAQTTIRASGPVGTHLIDVGDSVDNLYLNIPQSTLPYAGEFTAVFTTTKDDGRPATQVDLPVNVAPTLGDVTTLRSAGLVTGTGASATMASTAGPVDGKVGLSVTGVKSDTPVQLMWSTVVGNRINCHGVCWSFVSQQVGAGKPSGGTLHATVSVPDGLGGWHVVQVMQAGKVIAQVPYYVEESIVGQGVSSLVVKEDQPFSVHLKGVGWTQLDNTVAVDYDNSYIGYGCGFNSNGDVVLNLHATGGPGTHIIDIYPVLYTLSPSFANTPFGMLPVLTYEKDEPGLALGYRLPAIRLAITVVA